jgi:prepilin-type processing-associated H-X9-DG protein
VYPPGTYLGDKATQPEKRLSWMVILLPYLEQENLWLRVDKEQKWDSAENAFLAGTQLKTLVCPSTSLGPSSPASALTTYIGLAGVGADAATLPLKDKRAGMFGYDREVRPLDVKDGTSSTILIMETSTDLGPWAAGGTSTVRGLDPAQQPYLGLDGQFGLKHRTDTFFRTNPVGSNIGFADGSVRYVQASVSSQTLEALATIAGDDKPGDDY